MPRYSYERYNPGAKPAMYSVKRNIDGELICLCSYKRGAIRVCNELNALFEGKTGWVDPSRKDSENA